MKFSNKWIINHFIHVIFGFISLSAHLGHVDGADCQSLETEDRAIFVLFPSLEHYV